MSYRDIRRETAQRMGDDDDHGARQMACACCGAATSTETLAMHGARCLRCYAAFCAELPAVVQVPDAEAVPADAPRGLAWAYRLRWRHECGEPLSRAQVDAYKAVLRLPEAFAAQGVEP